MKTTLRQALTNLLRYAEGSECHHESTHRGGAIWTICDDCGKEWADDRGGFKPYVEPMEITIARDALYPNKRKAAPPSPAPMPERSATIGRRQAAGGMGEAERP